MDREVIFVPQIQYASCSFCSCCLSFLWKFCVQPSFGTEVGSTVGRFLRTVLLVFLARQGPQLPSYAPSHAE